MKARADIRADRARQGSRRRRDVEALASERTAPASVRPSDRAATVWAKAVDRMVARYRVSPAARDSWIDPVRVVGELQGAVCIVADPRGAEWLRRRYAGALGESIRAEGMAGLFVYEAEASA